MPSIALITDFGLQDTYVGVMKGVIAAIAPQVNCIDLTHHVPPQDIRAAQFHLMTACPYLPLGTVYLVVVDPGVGGDRRAVAVQFPFGTVVCPDNGLLTGLLQRHETRSLRAVTLTRPAYWRQATTPLTAAHLSCTFHGRDLFAPVAAHLAAGTPLDDVGDRWPATQLVRRPELALPARSRQGMIQHIDHFGNLISTLPGGMAQGHWQVVVEATDPKADPKADPEANQGRRAIVSGESYSSVPAGSLVAIVGSHGWIEVAANGASAKDILGAEVGTTIVVQYSAPA